MLKHKGFPGRFPGTDFQFTIRRAADRPTPLAARERYADRKKKDLEVDAYFLACLIDHFSDEPFERGNLDAGRLSWLLGREVKMVEPFDPASYDALLQVDLDVVRRNFPQSLSMETGR
ncbi:MAG: hypothetical protein AAF367_20475 [Pseudomonadota bacterium]